VSMASRHPDRWPRFWRDVARLWWFDVRRFRLAVAVVVALELLRAALAEWILHRGPLLAGQAFGGTNGAFEFQTLDGALWFAVAITTAMLVQADHPADDRGFLRSRPIGPWPLAIAKLTLLAALAVVLPFTTTATRLVAYGAPAASMAASALQFVVIGGAVVLPAWTLALLTRTLARFLASAAGVVLLWYVAIAAVVAMGPHSVFGDELLFRIHNRGILATFAPALTDWQRVDDRGWLFGVVMTILAVVVVLGYYRSRRPIASAAAGLALIALPAILPASTATMDAPPDVAAQIEGRLRLPALLVPGTTAMAQIAAHGGDRAGVFGDLILPSLPTNVSAQRDLGRVHLTGPGVDLWRDGLAMVANDGPRASAAAAGATETIVFREPDSEMLFDLPLAAIEAIRDRRVDLDAAVDLHITRHVLVADVPLRAGVAFRTDAYLVEILGLEHDREYTIVRYRFTRFPSLARTHANVLAFVGRPGTRMERAEPGMRPGFDPDFPADDRVGWAHGRTWARQHVTPYIASEVVADEPRLRIVESRPAGQARVLLRARDVPVRSLTPRPELPSAALPFGRATTR